MIVFLLLIQLVLCGRILHREVVQLQFRNFATAIFFGIYLIVFILEPLVLHLAFGGARTIVGGSEAYLTDPFIYYLFNAYGLGLLTCRLLLRSDGLQPEAAVSPSEPPPKWLGSALAGLIIFGVIIFIRATGMQLSELLVASRFAWFGEASFSLFWLTVSSYFVALLAAYTYMMRVQKQRNLWLLAACLAAIVLHGIITKDRKWVIYLASGWLAGHYELSGRRLVISRRAAIAFGAVFVMLVGSQFIRDVLFRYAIGEQVHVGEEFKRWQAFLIEYGDISYFYRASLEAIHQNVNNGFWVPFALVRRIAFFMIPARYSAGLKVPDISATFSDLLDAGDAVRSGNMPPGLFGLFIISFGWMASLVLIPSIVLLLRKLDAIFRYGHSTFRYVVLALYVFAAVLAFRGDDSSAFYFVMSTCLFIWALQVTASALRTRSYAID
jgi:hypothetical protein